MSFHLSFHQALLSPSGAPWLDEPPDLSCMETTRQHAVDDPLLIGKMTTCGGRPAAPAPRSTAGVVGWWRQAAGVRVTVNPSACSWRMWLRVLRSVSVRLV